eukprot:11112786-Ditylum_brightwellii.AAC.1
MADPFGDISSSQKGSENPALLWIQWHRTIIAKCSTHGMQHLSNKMAASISDGLFITIFRAILDKLLQCDPRTCRNMRRQMNGENRWN